MRHTAAATLLLLPTLLLAQKPAAPTAAKQSPATKPLAETALPVTRVSLYKNGVGFFEHTGTISGNAAVTLSFTSGQLNDVLQSLTAIDLNGGRISGAGYNSTTPLDQQLKALSLGLTSDPSDVDFYTAIRGARVQVISPSATISGRLLSIDLRELNRTTEPTADAPADVSPAQSRRFITVISDTGTIRTLELTPAVSVTLLDTSLHTDMNRYLELLDQNRNDALRHLTINDNGTGSRELKLSYISEVPVWKSTYRILFTDEGKSSPNQTSTLQGWSVVDNTTGTDWINVHLSLIAGAPQSFIQPLSQPIYSRRPEIPIAEEAQLTPQTHDSSIEADSLAKISPGVMAPKMAMGRASSVSMGSAGMPGISAKSDRYSNGRLDSFAAGPAPPPAISYEDSAEASLTPETTTAAFDDFFAYNLTEPVTILKNQSALVPILQAKVPADRVTLVSSDGSTISQPLRALWITNSSGLTLDRGSFSIVENGNFGGEGLLDPIHPGEKRLLSYAADQAVHVTTENPKTSSRIVSITAAKGVLTLHSAQVSDITYVLHNSAADARSIVLEHPVEEGLKLDASTPTPTETTPTVYRFRVETASGETTRLHIAGRRNELTTYELTRSDDNQLTLILNQTDHNAALVSALMPILAVRRQVSEAETAVNKTNARLTSLRADEERQRANITALATADKSSRDRFVRDLNTTEDAITAAQTELTTRSTALEAARGNLSTLIENLQINETL